MLFLKKSFLLAAIFLIGCYLSESNLPDYHLSENHKAAASKLGQDISVRNIMKNISYLSLNIGPRPAGSVKVNEAASWFRNKLQALGYTPQTHSFKLPDKSTGQNILCTIAGHIQPQIVVVAHLDTVKESPGANDDATGLALLIELARLAKQYKLKPQYTVILAGFGAEEAIDGFSGHAYSSLSYLKSLTPKERDEIVGCIYLDKIGVGRELLIRNTLFADSQMVDFCRDRITETLNANNHLPIKYGRMLSLPMSFEKYGIPTAWMEWAPDSHMHKVTDLPNHIAEENILLAANILLQLLDKGY
jgi:hypothetical protein